MNELIHEEKSYQLIGAAYEVYNEIGSGFLESVYQECLAIEFERQNIPFTSQKKLPMHYKDTRLDQSYQADFLCFDDMIIELKALDRLTQNHTSQVLNYLNIGDLRLGLLINFGDPDDLRIKRVVN